MVPHSNRRMIRSQSLNLDVSVFGFAFNKRSKRFGVSLGMEIGQHDLTPLPVRSRGLAESITLTS